ncbi:MAG: ABC transporter substrate-binding protein [Rubrobacter sp.]
MDHLPIRAKQSERVGRNVVDNFETANVGVTGSPSLEEVSSLAPDLILHTVGYDELQVETLSEIAPTVEYDAAEFSFDLARGLRFIAGIVNRRERAEEIIAEFDSRMEDLSLALTGRTFSLPAIELDQPGFTLYGPQIPLGRIVERLGGEIVPERVGDKVLEDYILDLSLERTNLVDADFVLASRYFDKTGDADSNFSRVADSRVWNSVPAIKRGDVTTLDVQLTTGSYGFIGLGQVLDTLASELS